MSYLILKDADIDRDPILSCNNDDCDAYTTYELAVKNYGEEISLNTLLDEMKFELFMENINKKSLEEIQNFFNKK